MNRERSILSPVLAALVASVALTACNNRNDHETAGQKVDQAVAEAKQEGREAKADAGSAWDKTKENAREATQDAKQGASDAMDKTAAAVSDAAITASVNAALAKDDKLSSLKIDVDTSNGHVALKGTAPDAASKERATQIASGVKGVTSVDNQLRVQNS
jgi:osmotically-inducible protein OsmY